MWGNQFVQSMVMKLATTRVRQEHHKKKIQQHIWALNQRNENGGDWWQLMQMWSQKNIWYKLLWTSWLDGLHMLPPHKEAYADIDGSLARDGSVCFKYIQRTHKKLISHRERTITSSSTPWSNPWSTMGYGSFAVCPYIQSVGGQALVTSLPCVAPLPWACFVSTRQSHVFAVYLCRVFFLCRVKGFLAHGKESLLLTAKP